MGPRAKGLGLLGKDNWKRQPQAMLVARATAECCRLVASDVLLGVPYAVEELEDNASDVPTAPAVTKKVSRQKPAVPAPEPPLSPAEEEATAYEVKDEDEPPVAEPDWPEVAKPGSDE